MTRVRGESTMLARFIGATACVLGLAASAAAQFQNQYGPGGYGGGFPGGYGGGGYGGFPGGGYGGAPGVMPNIYNPQSQPLSPYLNLFRGANPATNYYYGVRPGTVGGAGRFGGGAPNMAFGGNRTPFFPQLAGAPDPLALPEADPESTTALPPAGHPVVYGNTLGYFPSPFGNNGRGGMRNGLSGSGMGSGSGANRPATPRR